MTLCIRDVFHRSIIALLVIITITVVRAQEEGGYVGLCGDCWCTLQGDETCPELNNQYTYYPNPDWRVLETFNLVSPVITLEAADGSKECSPFRDLLGDDQMPESFDEGQFPQCVKNPLQTGNFCGYKFPAPEEEGETPACSGRDYEMMSYETLEELEADGAQLIHSGGTCSIIHPIFCFVFVALFVLYE